LRVAPQEQLGLACELLQAETAFASPASPYSGQIADTFFVRQAAIDEIAGVESLVVRAVWQG
jgi:hypothetical protein